MLDIDALYDDAVRHLRPAFAAAGLSREQLQESCVALDGALQCDWVEHPVTGEIQPRTAACTRYLEAIQQIVMELLR